MWNKETLTNAAEWKRCRLIIALVEAGFGTYTIAALVGSHPKTVHVARRNMRKPNTQSVYRMTYIFMMGDGMRVWWRRLITEDEELMVKIKALHPNARATLDPFFADHGL